MLREYKREYLRGICRSGLLFPARPKSKREENQWYQVMEENIKVIDPVCKMTLKDRNAAAASNYMNTTYYFCSNRCNEEFDRNPESYSRENVSGMHIKKA